MDEHSARDDIRSIRKPYLLFLGDVSDPTDAKTALGIRDWRPDWCGAQCRLPGCTLDLRLPEMDPAAAARAGMQSLVVGISPDGGALPRHWRPHLLAALDAGLDLVSGLHQRLNDDPELRRHAATASRRLIDVRGAPPGLTPGTGAKRSGKRLLTVGTDCAVGKKYTALALERALRERGVAADFCATGQTGVLIAERGLAIDSVVADFISGAAEWLSPAAAPGHWHLIEGQGSLFHPAYAAVTLGLIHGSQPDAMVLCHEAGRPHIGYLPNYPVPDLRDCVEVYQGAARLTNPQARCIGVALNTAALDAERAAALVAEVSDHTGLPCTDPLRFGCDTLLSAMDLG